MQTNTFFIIYQIRPIDNRQVILVNVSLEGLENCFNTKQQAIDALISKGLTYTNFIILEQTFITD